jgi:sugar phosphate isomerase/epimerase
MLRRSFIKQTALATTAISLNKYGLIKTGVTDSTSPKAIPISIFSKNLHWLNIKDMAVLVRQMGFDSIDLTVRDKGHVLPEKVTEDLPKAISIIKNEGLSVHCITTAITDVSEPTTEAIIKTASNAGIKYYRMGWYTYAKSQSVEKNLDIIREKMNLLSSMNKIYGIHGCYQNHAGEYFGAPLIDLYTVIKDFDPRWIGCQFDIRHATAEGAHSWPIGFDLLKNYIKTINVKDFQWQKKDNKWIEQNVPLGTGMVDFKKYVELLKKISFNGPVCIHYEYPLGGAEDGATQLSIPKEKVIENMKIDLATLKKMLADF